MKINNLIFNEDLISLEKKAIKTNLSCQEATLLKHKGWNEHKVQSAAKIFFDNLSRELQIKGLGKIFFFQIDNGANYLTAGAKVRKWKEGTRAKMPDVGMLVYSKKNNRNVTFFIEFKRVGTKREIMGDINSKSGLKIFKHFQEQLRMHEELREMGYDVYLTNNICYCETIIKKKIIVDLL